MLNFTAELLGVGLYPEADIGGDISRRENLLKLKEIFFFKTCLSIYLYIGIEQKKYTFKKYVSSFLC